LTSCHGIDVLAHRTTPGDRAERDLIGAWGRTSRHCPNRELVSHAQDRAGPPSLLSDQAGGHARYLRI